MEIVPSTFLALAAVLLMVIRGPYGSIAVFFALTPFGAAAAFNLPAVGGATISVTDLAALTLLALVLLMPEGPSRLVGSMRAFQPGFWLLLLALCCVVAALFLPRLFAGETEVFGIARKDNTTGIVSRPLRPGTGNITQLFRMTLGFITFYALATLLRRRPEHGLVIGALSIATVIHFTLGWLDVATYAIGMSELLDPIRTANYAMLVDVRMAGLKRMIGGFPEASAFGYYTLGLFGFWLQYWLASPGSKRGAWMLAASTLVLLRSTSSAAYVAAIAFGMSFALFLLVANLRRTAERRSVSIAAVLGLLVWVGALGLIAAYQLVDPVTTYLDRALFDKLETSSGVERMSWNAQAWVNFTETRYMGAGLGSMRASNWLLACLGSIGIIGTGVFLAFLISIVRLPAPPDPAERVATIRGLKAGCAALFVSALLTTATPDLGKVFFALAGLAAGLSRGAVVESLPRLRR
ncbi:hypothetical protein CLV78_102335 [Aliiruegeria haliotis]|uniref:O-antigen ligase-like membrane protein n=1 Tax=Aliiruegeria haliotis TaxID=1280846 RepID=A0A2T0RVI7_9RHOB|nr:hypothetical protein [Aliiruegeria haliotis]PRY25158.1 hypothetical protein CLV78_102335 [Aliiruegeria haliotis]